MTYLQALAYKEGEQILVPSYEGVLLEAEFLSYNINSNNVYCMLRGRKTIYYHKEVIIPKHLKKTIKKRVYEIQTA